MRCRGPSLILFTVFFAAVGIPLLPAARADDAAPQFVVTPERAKSEVFDAGASVTIKVDDSKFAGWTKWSCTTGRRKWAN